MEDRCPSCGHRVRRWRRSRAIYRCPDCHLVGRRQPPTEEELIGLHRSHYGDSGEGPAGADMESSPVALRNHAARIASLVGPGATVLDIGGGTGSLAVELGSLGVSCVVMEPVEEAARLARAAGFRTLDRLPVGDRFDGVVLIETLEHLLEPWRLLEEVKGLLAPGGWLYLATPNPDGLNARLRGESWREAVKPYHVYFFSPACLRHILTDLGYDSVRSLSLAPLTRSGLLGMGHRILQALGLWGGTRVVARKGDRA